KVTDPTTITESGTYYAFFYDTVNDCHNTDNSTASVVVTILPPCPSSCSGPDTDGDGIPDMCDLDSDNDGIPDLVENCKGYYSQNQNGPWSGDSTSTLTVTTSSGVSLQDNVENLSLDQRYKYYTNSNGANK